MKEIFKKIINFIRKLIMGKTISQITTSAATINGADLVEIEQGGVSKKSTVTNLLSDEVTARTAADAVNAAAIASEAATRVTADVNLATEITTRIKKDGSVAFTANQSMGSFRIINLAAPVSNDDAATKGYVLSLKVTDLTAPTGSFSMNSQKITNILNPTSAQDAVTVDYLKKTSGWSFDSGSDSFTLDAANTFTAGTDKNIQVTTDTAISSSREINVVSDSNYNSNFELYIFNPFTIASGQTLTLKGNGSILKELNSGTFPATKFTYIKYGSSYFLTEEKIFTPSDPENNTTPVKHGIVTAKYDFSINGGTISTKSLDVILPQGAIIYTNQIIIDVETPFTSGGAATIAWGYTGSTTAFDGATGYGSAPYTTANLIKAGSVTTPVKLTSAANVTITIAGAALTAGAAYIHIPYIINHI